MPQIISVPIEKFVHPDLELVLDRSEKQRRHDRRDHARKDAQWLETGPQQLADHNNHRGIQTDDARRCQRIGHAALENNVDVHQSVPVYGVPERNRNQHKRKDGEVNVVLRDGSRQTRERLKDKIGNGAQSGSASNPFHLLAQFRSPDRPVRVEQHNGAQNEVQTEVEIPESIQHVSQDDW